MLAALRRELRWHLRGLRYIPSEIRYTLTRCGERDPLVPSRRCQRKRGHAEIFHRQAGWQWRVESVGGKHADTLDGYDHL